MDLWARSGTIHEKYLEVFNDVQNVIGIAAVVFIYESLNMLRVWLNNAYSRPF